MDCSSTPIASKHHLQPALMYHPSKACCTIAILPKRLYGMLFMDMCILEENTFLKELVWERHISAADWSIKTLNYSLKCQYILTQLKASVHFKTSVESSQTTSATSCLLIILPQVVPCRAKHLIFRQTNRTIYEGTHPCSEYISGIFKYSSWHMGKEIFCPLHSKKRF